MKISSLVIGASCHCLSTFSGIGAEPFAATPPGGPAPIVVQAPEAWNWEQLSRQPEREALADPLFAAVSFLREGISRMTGAEPSVQTHGDPSTGIVLTTLSNAPEAIRNDERVQKALRNTGEDAYNANEAYFVRSETGRVVIVANTVDGLSHGVVALLESAGYEVLGMGPNWVHVPDFHSKPLVFSIEEEGRPGFYIRYLWPTTGQERGVGTLSRIALNDPADEVVEKSYHRWTTGTRQAGLSMPRVRGGHALGRYHREVVRVMRERGVTEGFLFEKVTLGRDAERPPAGAENEGAFWINTDLEGEPGYDQCFLSDGKEWKKRNLKNGTAGASLDLSSALTRGVILKAMIEKAEAAFSAHPDENFNFTTDPEDGSPQYARIAALSKNPDWYPEYLAAENLHFGPYALNGFKGLDQPNEIWDSNSPSDIIYAFNNWLLREYDKYVDSLPEPQRVTAAGESKKALVRCNLLSYNYHDVPPNFNLDPRIRIKIAGFPKHRGKGKWANFRTPADLAAAYRVLLPREPSVNYQIWSQAYFHDPTPVNIAGSPSAATIQRQMSAEYAAGFRGFETETDFNFGKFGLRYYLSAKMLWNPHLGAVELEGLRDRWLQRSFGSAWREMKAYYDFMMPEASRTNSPNSWAKAVRLIDEAGRRLSGTNEEDARRRIDDVKQFWYFYYLVESGQAKKDSPALREFVWKGQMSYMTAMVMVTKRFFDGAIKAAQIAGPQLAAGPAHYSREETAAWWSKVLEFWPLKPLQEFRDAVLANGTKGGEVSLNDLVRVREFEGNDGEAQNAIVYNHMPGTLLRKEPARFFTTAARPGDEIGFKLLWPAVTRGGRRNAAPPVPYGISRWNPQTSEWDELVDISMTQEAAAPLSRPDGSEWYQVEARYPVPQAGTYRVEVGPGALESVLTSLDYDPATGAAHGAAGQTYFSSLQVSGASPRTWYFYIPKGTRRLDLETSAAGRNWLRLYHGLPGGQWTPGRAVDIGKWGVHSIELKPGEDGSVAVLEGSAFPFLYSVPMLCAKTPSALLVPRAVAEADGLTPRP